jgi:hypothetical protein
VSGGYGALLWQAAAGVLAGQQAVTCWACREVADWLFCGVETWQACRAEAWLASEWWSGPMGQRTVAAWGLQSACSFSVLWHGEALHRLGVQGAEVSALPCALPQPRVSPVSQHGPSFTELIQSAFVF